MPLQFLPLIYIRIFFPWLAPWFRVPAAETHPAE